MVVYCVIKKKYFDISAINGGRLCTLTVKTDLTAPRPKEISEETARPFYGGGFYGQPLWMDLREVERRNERRKIRRHMNWIGEEPLTLAFETVFMTLAVTFLWRSD